jgi:hypothetical protein
MERMRLALRSGGGACVLPVFGQVCDVDLAAYMQPLLCSIVNSRAIFMLDCSTVDRASKQVLESVLGLGIFSKGAEIVRLGHFS